MNKLVYFVLAFILISCSPDIESVDVELFGWRLEIAEGWQMSTKMEGDIWTAKGKQVIKDKLGDNVNTNAFKPLIMLNTGFGTTNMFVASYTKFTPGENYKYNVMMRAKANERLFQGKKGVSITSKREEVAIDGVEFYAHFMDIFKNGELRAKQFSFERKYNNDDVFIIQCLAKPKDYKKMYDAFLKSKFTRKD